MTTATESNLSDCPESLTDDQLELYHEQGYIAFENAFSPEEVVAARADISAIIRKYAFNEELAEYRPANDSGTNYSGARFTKRGGDCGFWLEKGYQPDPDNLDELELMVRKLMWFQNENWRGAYA